MSGGALVNLDVKVNGSMQHGRAFLTLEALRKMSEEAIGSLLSARFVEEDDAARLPLLERALSQPSVTIETYPGEIPPHELHAYVVAPEVSDAPIFACVLAPLALVHALATEPPHVVLETATFQVIDGNVTNSTVISAIESWARRVWPAIRVPAVRLSPWPAHVEAADKGAALYKLLWFPPTVRTVPSGPETFSPPSDLADSEQAA